MVYVQHALEQISMPINICSEHVTRGSSESERKGGREVERWLTLVQDVYPLRERGSYGPRDVSSELVQDVCNDQNERLLILLMLSLLR